MVTGLSGARRVCWKGVGVGGARQPTAFYSVSGKARTRFHRNFIKTESSV